MIGAMFSTGTAGVSIRVERAHFGLLYRISASPWIELPVALLLFDGWQYVWHRANHFVPFLWRFHRMYHSNLTMDVTAAVRFHVGEILFLPTLRLTVIPPLGMQLWQVVLYEIILVPVIGFHHSNVALPEKWDPPAPGRLRPWVNRTSCSLSEKSAQLPGLPNPHKRRVEPYL